jgi:hypothetical protein
LWWQFSGGEGFSDLGSGTGQSIKRQSSCHPKVRYQHT